MLIFAKCHASAATYVKERLSSSSSPGKSGPMWLAKKQTSKQGKQKQEAEAEDHKNAGLRA